MEARNARSWGWDMLPYSPTQEVPAAICSNRSMSNKGTAISTAFHSSGCWLSFTPSSRGLSAAPIEEGRHTFVRRLPTLPKTPTKLQESLIIKDLQSRAEKAQKSAETG